MCVWQMFLMKHWINVFYVDKILIPFSESELAFEEKMLEVKPSLLIIF